jgi:dipeptidase E
MKLLLTSLGVSNDSIRAALENLLGKPFSECNAVCIPTAIYALPNGLGDAWLTLKTFHDLGWKSFGVLELTALPRLLEEHWLPEVEAADLIIVGGGNTGYLSHWFQTSGFAARLPDLLKTKVYLGVSAGSMMLTHSLHVNRETFERTGLYHDDQYDETAPLKAGSDRALGLVDFVIRPHLNADYFPAITLENAERWALEAGVPLYAFDDQSALKVVDGRIEVISEGEWRLFNAKPQ